MVCIRSDLLAFFLYLIFPSSVLLSAGSEIFRQLPTVGYGKLKYPPEGLAFAAKVSSRNEDRIDGVAEFPFSWGIESSDTSQGKSEEGPLAMDSDPGQKKVQVERLQWFDDADQQTHRQRLVEQLMPKSDNLQTKVRSNANRPNIRFDNANFRKLELMQRLGASNQKHEESKRRFETFRFMLVTSAVFASISAVLCLLISIRIVWFQRFNINRHLILLNEKVNALEARLGTRQLPETLIMKLCKTVGASYERIKEERQKAAQDIANDERMLMNEVINAAMEPSYDTMHGIRNEVFDQKADKLIANAADEYENVMNVGNVKKKEADEECVVKKAADEGYECYGAGEAPPFVKGATGSKEPETKSDPKELDGKAIQSKEKLEGADVRPDKTQDEAVLETHQKRTPTVAAVGLWTEKPNEVGIESGANLEVRPPAYAEMVDTNDPNYATLCGMENDKVFASKEAVTKAKLTQVADPQQKTANLQIRPPAHAAMVDTNDPNYATLCGMENDKVFVSKEAVTKAQITQEADPQQKTANLQIRPPAYAAMVDTDDPNYETLRGIHNSEIFGVKAKK